MYILNITFIFTLLISYSRTEKIASTSLFADVVKSDAFVDKTLLIKEILKNEFNFITAPRRFMKSTNLDMLRSFLSVSVNEQGVRQDVTSSPNYQLFKDLNIYKQEKELFDQHFGKYPIIYLDLNSESNVTTYDRILKILKHRTHLLFRHHMYLCNSTKLSKSEQTLCNTWCDVEEHNQFIYVEFVSGLNDLTYFLKKYFDSRVFVLVDNYDALIRTGLFDIEDNQLVSTTLYVVDLIARLVKGNAYVFGAVVTGVSHLPAEGYQELKDLYVFKFLHRHDIVQYYGFTPSEVEGLFKKPVFNLNAEEIKKAHVWYNGYTSVKGVHIYNPYSVLMFLNSGVVNNYWLETGSVRHIDVLFKLPKNKVIIEDGLLLNKSIQIAVRHRFKLENVIELKNTFLGIGKHINYDFLFSHLIELGYVTYTYHPSFRLKAQKKYIKLPNREIKEYFFQLLQSFYVKEKDIILMKNII